jgi:hypothetical protein
METIYFFGKYRNCPNAEHSSISTDCRLYDELNRSMLALSCTTLLCSL